LREGTIEIEWWYPHGKKKELILLISREKHKPAPQNQEEYFLFAYAAKRVNLQKLNSDQSSFFSSIKHRKGFYEISVGLCDLGK
jgi:hypothetical protein